MSTYIIAARGRLTSTPAEAARGRTLKGAAPPSRSRVLISRSGVLRRRRHRPPSILGFFVVPPTTPNKMGTRAMRGTHLPSTIFLSGEASPSVGESGSSRPNVVPEKEPLSPPLMNGISMQLQFLFCQSPFRQLVGGTLSGVVLQVCAGIMARGFLSLRLPELAEW